MVSFSELTKQVHLVNDLILTDMVCACTDDASSDETEFSRHLLATKFWFSRISWANKKRYVLALLEDVRSAWTLSLLLKSMWNCRPKDAVLSVSEQKTWSSYDQVPMDHNRTATPVTALAQVMKNDRLWFLMQEPENQAIILSELLTIAGGPVMWEVLRRAQILYERYRRIQLEKLQECTTVDSANIAPANSPVTPDKGKGGGDSKDTKSGQGSPTGCAQKELEANLTAWNATIKSMKDNLKLEELEMKFFDGTPRKVWKVNRVKPEDMETVDFIQLLPSPISKRIMSYFSQEEITGLARVNKYWAYLVDEYNAEIKARLKIDLDYETLHESMLRHDMTLEVVDQLDLPAAPPSSQGNFSTVFSTKMKPLPSKKASEKSAGVYSLRHFLSEKLKKPTNLQVHKPIKKLSELNERLELRGAADENLWKWCDNVLTKTYNESTKSANKNTEGVIPLGNAHFASPMMKRTVKVPLKTPLHKDPAESSLVQPRKNLATLLLLQTPKEQGFKRYSLWTRDFSGLYPVLKIPSYQSPFK